ncbi:hypothetical protein HK405_015434, partial [Cladochytrium tenue]
MVEVAGTATTTTDAPPPRLASHAFPREVADCIAAHLSPRDVYLELPRVSRAYRSAFLTPITCSLRVRAASAPCGAEQLDPPGHMDRFWSRGHHRASPLSVVLLARFLESRAPGQRIGASSSVVWDPVHDG